MASSASKRQWEYNTLAFLSTEARLYSRAPASSAPQYQNLQPEGTGKRKILPQTEGYLKARGGISKHDSV